MKQQIFFSILLMTGLAFNGYAQQKDAQKQRQDRNFYRKTLQLDSVKAEQVAKIQSDYKIALNRIVADTALNEAAKRVKINVLIEGKNQQLRSFLSLPQQQKIIPTTEREPSKNK